MNKCNILVLLTVILSLFFTINTASAINFEEAGHHNVLPYPNADLSAGPDPFVFTQNIAYTNVIVKKDEDLYHQHLIGFDISNPDEINKASDSIIRDDISAEDFTYDFKPYKNWFSYKNDLYAYENNFSYRPSFDGNYFLTKFEIKDNKLIEKKDYTLNPDIPFASTSSDRGVELAFEANKVMHTIFVENYESDENYINFDLYDLDDLGDSGADPFSFFSSPNVATKYSSIKNVVLSDANHESYIEKTMIIGDYFYVIYTLGPSAKLAIFDISNKGEGAISHVKTISLEEDYERPEAFDFIQQTEDKIYASYSVKAGYQDPYDLKYQIRFLEIDLENPIEPQLTTINFLDSFDKKRVSIGDFVVDGNILYLEELYFYGPEIDSARTRFEAYLDTLSLTIEERESRIYNFESEYHFSLLRAYDISDTSDIKLLSSHKMQLKYSEGDLGPEGGITRGIFKTGSSLAFIGEENGFNRELVDGKYLPVTESEDLGFLRLVKVAADPNPSNDDSSEPISSDDNDEPIDSESGAGAGDGADAGGGAVLGTGAGTGDVINSGDDIAPFIVSTNPEIDSENVDFSSTISIEFSEPIFADAGNIFIKRYSDEEVLETIKLDEAQNIKFDDRVLSIDLLANLSSEEAIYIQIETNAIKDSVGNFFVGIDDKSFKLSSNMAAAQIEDEVDQGDELDSDELTEEQDDDIPSQEIVSVDDNEDESLSILAFDRAFRASKGLRFAFAVLRNSNQGDLSCTLNYSGDARRLKAKRNKLRFKNGEFAKTRVYRIGSKKIRRLRRSGQNAQVNIELSCAGNTTVTKSINIDL